MISEEYSQAKKTGLQLAKPYEGFREELEALLDSFSQNGDLIHDARNQIKVFKWSGGELVIKSFKVPHLLNKFVYSFIREPKAKRSFDYSLELLRRGVGTPAPMGYLLESKQCLLNRSYYISEKFDYDYTFHDVFYKRVELHPLLLKSFANFVFDLHSKGVLHLDFTPGNILVKKNAEDFLFQIVDVNRMKFGNVNLNHGCENLGKLSFEEDQLLEVSKWYALKQNCDKMLVYDLIKKARSKFVRNKRFINKLRGRA